MHSQPRACFELFGGVAASLPGIRPAVLPRAGSSVMLSASTPATNPWRGLALWAALFMLSAGMHSAECAITKISPWKVKQVAKDEGPASPFALLSRSREMTSLLIAILLATTAMSIYSTALFVASASALLPHYSLGAITAALTAITMFAGELLPKALAVSNSEVVVRKAVPLVAKLAAVLSPLTAGITVLSDLVLRLLGMRSEEDRSVSEDMLRLVVDQAARSAEGIGSGEGRMIKAVLDMQDREVGRIVQPRVAVQAVPEGCGLRELLAVAVSTKYSRLPVYRADIDHIVGIVLTKDLLDHWGTSSTSSEVTAAQLMDAAYFVPEAMTCWTALQEMRRRRVHMAIVVDEWGGTAGLVTLEDLLEEVVGEIFDEDEGSDEQADRWTIFRQADASFKVKAHAHMDDVVEALGLGLGHTSEEVQALLTEHSTLGGLLCGVAGHIPAEGDTIRFAGYAFTVSKVEDQRRIVDLLVTRDKEVPLLTDEEVQGTGSDSAAEEVPLDGQDGGDFSAEEVDGSTPEGVFQDGLWVDPNASN